MKFGIRAGLGILSFAVTTALFTGCGADSVPTSAPIDDSHVDNVTIKPQTPDVKDKFTKWVDASQGNQKTAEAAQDLIQTLNKTDQNLYGIYDVYEKNGVNYIISGSNLVELNGEGKISVSDRQFLRMPGSNQRVYIVDSESYAVLKATYDTYADIVEDSAAINFTDRNNSEGYIKTPARMFRDLVINGMYQYGENTNVISPPENVLAEGCAFNLEEFLGFLESAGYVSDLDRTINADMSISFAGKLHTPTAVEDFTIHIQSPTFDVEGLGDCGNLSELGGTFTATRGDNEYNLDAAVDGLNVYIREDVLASLFQMDLDECELEDGTPVLMIVTDIMDLPSDAVIIEDTSLAQPVNQEVVDHGPSNEGATYETDAEQQVAYDAHDEQAIQGYMDRGHTREEAESWLAARKQAGQQAAADEQKRLEETTAREKELLAQQAEEVKKESDAYYYERYGLSLEEVKGKSYEELCQLFMQRHGG